MIPRPILFGLIAIAGIWLAVAMVVKLADQHRSSPEKVMQLMAQAPWNSVDEGDPAMRRAYLRKVIDQVNLLDFDQRRQMRESRNPSGERFFSTLSQDEKNEFLEQTVEQHFKSLMKAFNQMSPEERAKVVEQARKDLQRNEVEGQNVQRLKDEDEQVFERLVEKGLGAYYEEASAETKLDLAPLLEEMQQRLRSSRSRF